MRFLMIAFSLLLTSCLVEERTGPPLQKACTLIATVSNVRVDIGPSSDLPAFIAVEHDGIMVDECDTQPGYSAGILRYRDHGFLIMDPPRVVVDDMITHEIDFDQKLSLKLYGRASCGDPLQLLKTATDLAIR